MSKSSPAQVWDKFWLARSLQASRLAETLASRDDQLRETYSSADLPATYSDFLSAWNQSDDYLRVIEKVLKETYPESDHTAVAELVAYATKDENKNRVGVEKATTTASVVGELLWVLRTSYKVPFKLETRTPTERPGTGIARLLLPVCRIFTEPNATKGNPWNDDQSEYFGWDDLHDIVDWRRIGNFEFQSTEDIRAAIRGDSKRRVSGLTFTQFSDEFLDAATGELLFLYEKTEIGGWCLRHLLPTSLEDAGTQYAEAVRLLAKVIVPEYLNYKYESSPIGSEAFQICCGLTGRPLTEKKQTAAYFFLLAVLEFTSRPDASIPPPGPAEDLWNRLDSIKVPLLLHIANEQQNHLEVELGIKERYENMYKALAPRVHQITLALTGLQGEVQQVVNLTSQPEDYWLLSYQKVEPLFEEKPERLKLSGRPFDLKIRHRPNYYRVRGEDGCPFYQGLYLFGHAIRGFLNLTDLSESINLASTADEYDARSYYSHSLKLLVDSFKERSPAALAIGRILSVDSKDWDLVSSFAWQRNWNDSKIWQQAQESLSRWLRVDEVCKLQIADLCIAADKQLESLKSHVHDFQKKDTTKPGLLGSLVPYLPMMVTATESECFLREVWQHASIKNNWVLVRFLRSFTGSTRFWVPSFDANQTTVFTLVNEHLQQVPLHNNSGGEDIPDNTALAKVLSNINNRYSRPTNTDRHFIVDTTGWTPGSASASYIQLAVDLGSRASTLNINHEQRSLTASSRAGALTINVDANGQVRFTSHR